MSDFELIRSGRRSVSVEITREGRVVVRAPERMPMRDIERLIAEKQVWIEKHLEMQKKRPSEYDLDLYSKEQTDALKTKARACIPSMLERYAPLVGVSYGKVKINRAKGRFGSCSTKSDLNFSCFLMLYPQSAVEYVVVHELCHILEHNHSRRFWAQVERVLPDYKEREKLLKYPR